MRTDHAHRVASLPVLSDCERNDGGAISREIVFTAGLEQRCPRVSFLQVKINPASKQNASASLSRFLERWNLKGRIYLPRHGTGYEMTDLDLREASLFKPLFG